MRALIVVAADHYVRSVIEPGTFQQLDPSDTHYAISTSGVTRQQSVAAVRAASATALRAVSESRGRRKAYANLQLLLLYALRRRSKTMAAKIRSDPWYQRVRFGVLALPGVRSLARAWYLAVTGRNAELHQVMRELAPEIVIAPSGGIDPLVTDAIRSARSLGIKSLVLAYNWDNLSSKGAFPVKPDMVGVWGPQSAEHARLIHGFRDEQIVVLGSPTLDPYFRRTPGTEPSPFAWPYVLFAGCYARFDERDAVERLDPVLAQREPCRLVYRPHPHRRPRLRDDRIDETRLARVVIDPQVRDLYERSFEKTPNQPLFPPLDYYPGLLDNAEVVVCPLSTMLIEAAIFERPVIVVAYDDGLHSDSPATAIDFDHFEGIIDVPGLYVARSPREMEDLLARLLDAPTSTRPNRDSLGWWLYHDDRTYADRLAALVNASASQPTAS